MKLEFGFGTGVQCVELPEKNLMGVLHANPIPDGLTGEDAVRAALDAPIGAPALGEVVRPGEKVVIVTSDITRPCPSWVVLPPLLDRLYAAGVKREDITLVFALGSHRRHTEAEQRHLAGERAWRPAKLCQAPKPRKRDVSSISASLDNRPCGWRGYDGDGDSGIINPLCSVAIGSIPSARPVVKAKPPAAVAASAGNPSGFGSGNLRIIRARETHYAAVTAATQRACMSFMCSSGVRIS